MNKKARKLFVGSFVLLAVLLPGTKFLPSGGSKTVEAGIGSGVINEIGEVSVTNLPQLRPSTKFAGLDSISINGSSEMDHEAFCINTKDGGRLNKNDNIGFYTVYRLTVTCTLPENSDAVFAQENFSAKVNGSNATVDSLTSKSVTFSYDLPRTDKAKLLSVAAIADIEGVKNGAPKTADGLGLPEQISISTEISISSAKIDWDLNSSSYDPDKREEQSFTVNGRLKCPDDINPNGKDSVFVCVAVSAAREAAAAPETDVKPGGFAVKTGEFKTIHLSSRTPDAVIYYTIDGSEPTFSSIQYNGSIQINKTTTIKAIAIARGYLNSAGVKFTFNKLKGIYSLQIKATAPAAAGKVSDTDVSIPGRINYSDYYYQYYQKAADGDVKLDDEDTFGYHKTYYLRLEFIPDSEYVLTENVTATVNGQSAEVAGQSDGSLVITYTFRITDKAALHSYESPKPITGVRNGAPKTEDGLGLPKKVSIDTEDTSVKYADVAWRLNEVPISGENSYDPQKKEAQTFTVGGTVICPEEVDSGEMDLNVRVTVTVNAKSESSAPPSSGQGEEAGEAGTIPPRTGEEDIETIPAEIREEDRDSKTLAVKVSSTLREEKVIADVTLPVEQIRSMAGGGTEETAVEISIRLDSKKVRSALADKKIKTAELNLTLNSEMMEKEHLNLTEILLGEELLKSARSEGKELILSVSDENRTLLYRWNIDGAGLGSIKPLNLAVDTDEKEAGMDIRLQEAANLPSGVLLQVNTEAGARTKPGQTVYLYHYNESAKKLESLPRVIYKVDGNGCISIPVKISGSYVLLTEKPKPAERISLLKQVKVRQTLTVESGNQSLIVVSIPDTVKRLSSFSAKELGRIAPSEKAAVIRYESLTPDIALVNRKTGVVTAKKKGKAVIRARVTIRGGGTKLHKIAVKVK